MPAGFRLKNDDLVLQVTDDVPNYHLHSEVTDFEDASGLPANAIFAWAGCSGYGRNQHISSQYPGRCFCFAPCNEIPYTRPTSGLIGDIRNAANELMFSINLRPLTVVDFVEWDGSGTTLVKTYAAGREYAIIVLAEYIYEIGSSAHVGDGGEGEEIWDNQKSLGTVDYKIEDNVVTFSKGETVTDSWTSYETGNNTGIFIPALAPNGYIFGDGTRSIKALIVDVTGL